MTKNRYKLANPNNLFKDMNIGIVENNTCMLKLIDVVELLNNLSDENEKLKQYNEEEIKFISDINGIYRSALLDSEYDIKKLEQDIKYLEKKIKENEWHWNTIDEDRDVWHYKCNQAEERVKELKDENEQLKKKIGDIDD